MRKRSRRAGLVLTIVTAVFFVLAASLFFLLPTIDEMIGRSPVGFTYNPAKLFVEGAKTLVSFNFASKIYLIIFISGCIVAALLLLWLVAIIVKKKPIKLITWFVFTLMCAACGIMAFGYSLAAAREVTLFNGARIDQHIFLDMIGYYGIFRLSPKRYGAAAADAAPYIFYNFLTWILAWVFAGLLIVIYIFAIITPAVAAGQLFAKEKVRKAKPVEEEEDIDEEALAEARRRAALVSYVEYKAGIPSREKEYEELCRANGIALPGDEVVEDPDEEYYRQTAASLRVLHEQPAPAPEVDPDEEYYKELTKNLAVFKLAKASQDVRLEKYYRDTIEELDMFKGDKNEEATAEAVSVLKRDAARKRAYYQKLIDELPCLQYQKDPVEPEVGKDVK